jgi:hypothetical protein
VWYHPSRRSNLDYAYGSPTPAGGRIRQGLSDRLISEHFANPATTLQRGHDITDCYDVETSGGVEHGLKDYGSEVQFLWKLVSL